MLVHDATDTTLSYMISNMDYPQFPVPMGIFLEIERPTYEDMLSAQIERAKAKAKGVSLQESIAGNNTLTVA